MKLAADSLSRLELLLLDMVELMGENADVDDIRAEVRLDAADDVVDDWRLGRICCDELLLIGKLSCSTVAAGEVESPVVLPTVLKTCHS